MGKTVVILTFLLCVGAAAFGAKRADEIGLRDGFVLRGVDGKLAAADGNEGPQVSGGRWFFEFDSELTDGRGRVAAGTKLELLPSAGLERMTADAERVSEGGYRLRGRVTRYRGRNFIFVTSYVPVSKSSGPARLKDSEDEGGKTSEQPSAKRVEEQVTIDESNDVIALPPEIVERLRKQKTVRGEIPVGGTGPAEQIRLDSVMVDRTGFVAGGGGDLRQVWERLGFILDGSGRNAGQERFGLLACEELERAERRRLRELEAVRFKITGIVTRYKGRDYLLLLKATQVYGCGNFPR